MLRACFAMLGLCVLLSVRGEAQAPPIYQNPKASLEARIDDLFSKLTQQEKISLLSGIGPDIQGIQPIPPLGIPSLTTADGAQGMRGGSSTTNGPATLFPGGICEAATWNTGLIGELGAAIGEEARNKGTGVQIILGPDVNIHRSPLGGRNGESFTEDPYLNAKIAAAYIQGMQSTGIGATVKHYACNNEESDRGTVDVRVDQRALHEIYFPAFEAAVKEAHTWALMSSYNQVNGHYSSANRYMLTDVLKDGWGFDGIAMSDWGGVHETAGVINAGTDLEMPGQSLLKPEKVAAALAAGEITQTSVDDSVRRILRTIIRTGLLDGPMRRDPTVVGNSAHQELAYKVATEGIVLLKNQDAVLPLDRKKIRTIAAIGPRAKTWLMGAQGGVYLDPTTSIGPLEALQASGGKSIAVQYVQGLDLNRGKGSPIPPTLLSPEQAAGAQTGLTAEYFNNQDLRGTPSVTRIDPQADFDWDHAPAPAPLGHDHFSVRWTGFVQAPVTGTYTLSLQADDGCRMWFDGKQVVDAWQPSAGDVHTTVVHLTAGKKYSIRVEYFQDGGQAYVHLLWQAPQKNDFQEAVSAARNSDVALVFVGTTQEEEGHDRPSMDLPYSGDQDALIEAVAAANKNTIVVLNNGGPVRMTDWIGKVKGVIEAFYPGELGGRALADIVFGDVNPSGKLPDTIGMNREDYPDNGNFPGTKGVVRYTEGIYVGYRHFDKAKIKPLFPFGFGLSYTTFRFSPVKLSQTTLSPAGNVTATVDVTNTGSRKGATVVQLYIRDPHPKIDKPVRELKGFARVDLLPGQTKRVSIAVNARSLAYWDVASNGWKADAGSYEVEAGTSSRDLRSTARLRLTGDYRAPMSAPLGP